VASPMMSIDKFPNERLKVLYVGTAISNHAGGRRVSFLLQNVSSTGIRFYAVSCSKSRPGTTGSTYSESHSYVESFRSGASQPFTCDCEANDTLQVSVNAVELVDGSKWSKNQPQQ
jgi:hypothetical protein